MLAGLSFGWSASTCVLAARRALHPDINSATLHFLHLIWKCQQFIKNFVRVDYKWELGFKKKQNNFVEHQKQGVSLQDTEQIWFQEGNKCSAIWYLSGSKHVAKQLGPSHKLTELWNEKDKFLFISPENLGYIFCYLKPKGQRGSYLQWHELKYDCENIKMENTTYLANYVPQLALLHIPL